MACGWKCAAKKTAVSVDSTQHWHTYGRAKGWKIVSPAFFELKVIVLSVILLLQE